MQVLPFTRGEALQPWTSGVSSKWFRTPDLPNIPGPDKGTPPAWFLILWVSSKGSNDPQNYDLLLSVYNMHSTRSSVQHAFMSSIFSGPHKAMRNSWGSEEHSLGELKAPLHCSLAVWLWRVPFLSMPQGLCKIELTEDFIAHELLWNLRKITQLWKFLEQCLPHTITLKVPHYPHSLNEKTQKI